MAKIMAIKKAAEGVNIHEMTFDEVDDISVKICEARAIADVLTNIGDEGSLHKQTMPTLASMQLELLDDIHDILHRKEGGVGK